mmetsp:Transcript_17970/g.18736  ORF Transcript_17970/g.18736 Transcript_17970/m.18736 type:complete len:148 (-) Transcript_17970:29-472(-)
MGCCPCWKSSNSSNEYTPIARETPIVIEATQPIETNKTQYYQSVIDIAQKKFISSVPRLFPRDDRGEELRNKIKQANVAVDLVSPPQKKSYLQWGVNNSSQQVIDILSAPVLVNNYDIVADELAEMAATHTFNMNADDSTNSTVVSF